MSRVCRECNTVLDDTAKFCFHCGALVSASADGQTMPLNNDGEEIDRLTDNDKATSVLTEETGKLRPEDMSGYVPLQPSFVPNVSAPDVYNEKELYEGFVSKKAKGWTTAIGVIALISGAVNIPILFLGNLFAIIDIVFYVLMGILILTTKKWDYRWRLPCTAALLPCFHLRPAAHRAALWPWFSAFLPQAI